MPTTPTPLTRDDADKLFRRLHDQITAIATITETLEHIIDSKAWVPLGHDTFHAAWLAYKLDEITAAIELRPAVVYQLLEEGFAPTRSPTWSRAPARPPWNTSTGNAATARPPTRQRCGPAPTAQPAPPTPSTPGLAPAGSRNTTTSPTCPKPPWPQSLWRRSPARLTRSASGSGTETVD